MSAKPSRWIPIFEEFIRDLRISSKEESSEDSRGTPLKLWNSQRRFLEFIGKGLDDGIHKFYCLKSRQLGCTTISLAVDVFWAAMHKNMNGAIIVDTDDNREKNRAVIKKYVESFPEGYFGDEFYITKNNRNFLEFSNGSRFDFKIAGVKKKSIAWAEGAGYVMAHATELGKYGDGDGMQSFEEAMPQTNPIRLLICESTACGMNHWREMFYAAAKDPYTKRSIFLGWYTSDINTIPKSDPRFLTYGTYAASGEEREKIAAVQSLYDHKITPEQLAWIRWRADNVSGDDGVFTQNQPWIAEEAFVLSGYSFFQTRQIAKDLKEMIDAPQARVEDGGYSYSAYYYELGNRFFDMRLVPMLEEDDDHEIELRVWSEPVKGAKYVIGCDPAWGRNEFKDRHGIEVWRCYSDKLVQVAEYATSNVEVKHAAWVLAHLAGAYEDSIVCVDVNGPGRVIMMEFGHIRELLNAEMNENLVKHRDWENALGQARWYLYNRVDSMGGGFQFNFETTTRNKTELMHAMRGSYVTRELIIRSLPLLEEMRIVVADGDSIGAPESSGENNKDDRVFATALCVRSWINWRRPELLAQGLTYQSVSDQESGRAEPRTIRLNNIVQRFLLTQAEKAALPDIAPNWRVDMGLE